MIRSFNLFSNPLCFAVLSGILIACQSSRSVTNHTRSEDTNNIVTVQKDNTVSNSKDEIIFDGSGNLIEIIQKNAQYFDQTHDIIILKGDGNIIRLYNINILDLRTDKTDTLIIVGNREKYVLNASNMVATDRTLEPDTIALKGQSVNIDLYSQDIQEESENEEKIALYYFDEKVTTRYAFDFFLRGTQNGKLDCSYELAELYLYGIGVEASIEKAIELNEYAAAKDYIPSIRRLAEIYSGKFGSSANQELKLYYLKRGSMLGDSYCKELLKTK